MTDIVDELRNECLASCQLPARPDGPSDEEAAVLDRDARWRAAVDHCGEQELAKHGTGGGPEAVPPPACPYRVKGRLLSGEDKA